MHQTELKGNVIESLDPRLNGSFGIVLLPDDETVKACHRLAGKLLPQNSEFVAVHSHITLYHGIIADAPSERLLKLTDRLAHLVGASFELNEIQIFGGKFVFYNLVPDPKIRAAHNEALCMAKYLDNEALTRAEEERLDLTDAQRENLKKYGHPLVRDLHIPHITLGYSSELGNLPDTSFPKTMSVKSVSFASIGSYGSVEKSLYEVGAL